jgi:hypothetical protein
MTSQLQRLWRKHSSRTALRASSPLLAEFDGELPLGLRHLTPEFL